MDGRLGNNSLFGPVEDNLKFVEERVRAAAHVEMALLASMIDHVLARGGKRIRPAMTLLAGHLFNYDLERLLPMATGVELLHNGTLVHDDIVDSSSIRRGRPTAGTVWNTGAALLLGDYLLANAAEQVSRTENTRVMRLFAETLMTICKGELSQAQTLNQPSIRREDYYRRIAHKTASLFSMASESGAVLAGAPEDAVQALRQYGHDFGMAFQVVDDILDFTATEAELGKPVGSDLLQGTITLPTVLFLEEAPQSNPVRSLLDSADRTAGLPDALAAVRESGAISEAYSMAEEFAAAARRVLASLPDGETRRTLDSLAEYTVRRQT